MWHTSVLKEHKISSIRHSPTEKNAGRFISSCTPLERYASEQTSMYVYE